MEHSTVEQTGEEAGKVEDLVYFRGNEACRRPAAQFPSSSLIVWRSTW